MQTIFEINSHIVNEINHLTMQHINIIYDMLVISLLFYSNMLNRMILMVTWSKNTLLIFFIISIFVSV